MSVLVSLCFVCLFVCFKLIHGWTHLKFRFQPGNFVSWLGPAEESCGQVVRRAAAQVKSRCRAAHQMRCSQPFVLFGTAPGSCGAPGTELECDAEAGCRSRCHCVTQERRWLIRQGLELRGPRFIFCQGFKIRALIASAKKCPERQK